MSKVLEMLGRIETALDPRNDTVSITAEGRRQLAQLHLEEAMQHAGLSDAMRETIRTVDDGSPDWVGVKERAADLIGKDGYVGDAEHMHEYCRLVIMAAAAHDNRTGQFTEEDQRGTSAACDHFRLRHLRAPDDYAPDVTDTLKRVMLGCDVAVGMTTPQFDSWLMDIDVMKAKAQRHEYSSADLNKARAKLATTGRVLLRDDPRGTELVAMLDQQLAEIARVADRHALGPAHLEALEHQWRAYKFNSGIAPKIRDNVVGALQQHSIVALRAADTFCWAPQTTQAVMASAEGLPQECAPGSVALGDLAHVGRSGWWWFQEPVPVQTTNEPGTAQPVVALLWRYGMQSVPPPPDFPQLQPEPKLGLWFQTFVMAQVPLHGRLQDVAIPTTAFIWHDGVPLSQLPRVLLREYNRIYTEGKVGADFASPEVTVDASMAFARFFLAGAAWLRQKIVVETVGTGTRQAARQIQRAHGLRDTPRVRVVELRRTDYVRREDAPAGEATGRRLSVRFVVKGFWRQQWYASRNEHAPKYIESFMKGPADAPLKAAAPTVYVVRR